MSEGILVEYRGKIAIITLNVPKKLNALTADLYYHLARAMHEVATHDEVIITVLTGVGRFFSAGADVSFGSAPPSPTDIDTRHTYLRSFVAQNLHITRAFYTHPKLLITALNGPAVGLSAALVAFSDFVYAVPGAYIFTPFSSLGLVAEGGASYAFVRRLGVGRANEALLMGKRIGVPELQAAGFVNGVFDAGEGFLGAVLGEVENRLGDHLNGESLLGIKKLMRRGDVEALERQGVEEVFGGLDRFIKGVPQEEFRRLASGEKRHKL
ncbi:peroxisomal d3,d2-enoyl-CoA isomeras-like protein [Boeremia exigua]|uniref:peroxisomal d3,d2-enoyl-CoA isomerase-like protein n=1 Tax=Boeremia exigua TaxID=749465 RepID=UPI001E8D19DB|nr:peroxisomal d3,d2-enoyl-CoA isomerase-like protein [Boeremia exigua]KAH6642702.1 peroxisomal d3,d2-enoyl-CoA isomeras-like protein [Boeremia exigua]